MNCKGRLVLFDKPLLMGIINTTPDSFYEGSRAATVDAVLARAEQMLNEGADIIDIGAQSTRPGSERVSEEEEMKRIVEPIGALHKNFPHALISVDTFYSKVAKYAVDAGAHIVNDVSAGSIDPHLIPVVASLKVPYVLMHMQGDPQTMQKDPKYKNVVLDVFDGLNQQLQKIKQAGIVDVIIDPGFGFGKTAAHNFKLLSALDYFHRLGCPVLAGLSRKATIYKTLNVSAEEALNGTTVMHTIALMNGADLLRVHDVKQAREAITLFLEYKKQKEQPV